MGMAARKRVAQSSSIPACVGGLNARDSIANMPETDAIILDNWFPTTSDIQLRNGYSVKATFTGTCQTVMAYTSGSASKLFAAVANGSTYSIYDATSGGALSTAAVGGAGNTIEALTSAQFDYLNFATTGGQFLMCVNGLDTGLQYNGSAWSTWTVTGVNTANIQSLVAFKERIWMIEKNTFNVWYLGIQSITGTATKLFLGSFFKLGGYLQAMVTISIDNSNGTNDFIAFVSSVGEVIIYEGTDPSSAQTWTMAAHFRLGRPIGIGRRCWTKFNSDAILITADGFFPLSQGLLTDRAQQQAVSDKIRNAVNSDVATYGNNFGWQIILYPIGNKLIINMPSATLSTSYQYVMNTITNAWCTFGKNASPWNAFCWEVLADSIYFGANGYLAQADTGTADNTALINADVKPAFSYYGQRGQLKRWTLARPILTTSGTIGAALDLNVDFANDAPTSTPTFSPGVSTAWGSPWNSPWSGTPVIQKDWQSVTGVGMCASTRMRIQSNVAVRWAATDYLFEPGGYL